MDQRRDQLLAAADVLRTWLHTRRTVWSTDPIPTPPATPRLPTHPETTRLAFAEAVTIDADVERSAPIEVRMPDGGVLHWLHATAGRCTLFLSAAWPMFAAGTVVIAAAIAFFRFHGTDAKAVAVSTLATASRAVDAGLLARQAPAEPMAPAAATSSDAKAAVLTGRLVVESDPAGAQVLVDGSDRGVTPLTVDALKPGSHNVLLRASAGSVQRTVSITASETTELSEAIFSGWVRVSSSSDLRVSEGGRAIILDDSNQALLAPGRHDLRLENRELGISEVRRITIEPGATTLLELSQP